MKMGFIFIGLRFFVLFLESGRISGGGYAQEFGACFIFVNW